MSSFGAMVSKTELIFVTMRIAIRRPGRAPLPELEFNSWRPEASVRCVAALRPESGVKPTCRHCSTDANDPKRLRLPMRGVDPG